MIGTIQNEPVLFIEKSRDLMISWLCVGYFTHAAMTNDEREVLFQSQKEDKAAELIDYAKTLYEQQHEQLQRRFPLAKPLKEQSALKLEFANGSRIIGIPEGADQIRSYHPWGLTGTRSIEFANIGKAYFESVIGHGIEVAAFWVHLRDGKRMKINLRTFPIRAAATCYSQPCSANGFRSTCPIYWMPSGWLKAFGKNSSS